jgi:hypothetical protein
LHVRGAGQDLPGRSRSLHIDTGRRLHSIQGIQQALPGALRRRQRLHRLEKLSQGGAAEIRHAQGAEPARGIVLHGIERHDMRMLEPRQGEVLVRFTGRQRLTGRELEHHRTVAEREFACQEDPAVSAPAQLGQEEEVAQEFAEGGELRRQTAWTEEALAIDKDFQLCPPLGKAAQDFFHRHFPTVFLAQAKLFVNQIRGRRGMVPESRVLGQKILGQHALALPPALNHFGDQLGG